MSWKRRRTDEEEACEALGGLLRQTAARAIERLRLQRQQRSGGLVSSGGVALLPPAAAEAVVRTAKPMDVLVIRFCVNYLDVSSVAPPNQFVRLAQEVVTKSVERVLVPQLFARGNASLPALCEALVAEHTADEMQTAVKEVNEFVEARGALGAWLADAAAGRGGHENDDAEDDDDSYNRDSWGQVGEFSEHHRFHRISNEEGQDGTGVHQDNGNSSQHDGSAFYAHDDLALASALYRACEYWVRVHAFLNALSLHSARLHVFRMPPRYERELLLLLFTATRGSRNRYDAGVSGTGRRGVASNADVGTHSDPASPFPPLTVADRPLGATKVEAGRTVKPEPSSDGEDEAEKEYSEHDDENGSAQSSPTSRRPLQLYQASALLADVLALSRCPAPLPTHAAPSPTEPAATTPRITSEATQQLKGISPDFYSMVYARLGVMVARDRLHCFDKENGVVPAPLTVEQRNLQEQLLQQEQTFAAAGVPGLPGQAAAGLPTTYVPDDAYFDKLMHQQHDTIDEDEEVYKGEVMDYYMSHPNRSAVANGSAAPGSSSRGRQQRGNKSDAGEVPLVKPHRFCKVKTGFSWTQYNRTHYDSRTNPPPRTEMWYEFTLFYPALANTKRDMRHIFRIEDAPEGPNDQYCLLVFSVGPPYADVAYRIRKKQWDTRRGGVRISFDQTGRYKLFFRFTNSNYRR